MWRIPSKPDLRVLSWGYFLLGGRDFSRGERYYCGLMRNCSSPLCNLGNASKFTHCHCFGLKSPWISPALSASPDTAASASLLWEFSRLSPARWQVPSLFLTSHQVPSHSATLLEPVPSKWIILDLMEKNGMQMAGHGANWLSFHVFCIQHVQQLHIWEIGQRHSSETAVRAQRLEAFFLRTGFVGDSWWFMVIHGDSWWFMVIPLKTLAIFPIGQIGQPTRHWTLFSSVGPWIVPQNVFCSLAKPYRVQQNKKAKKLRAKHGHKARVAQKMGQWISESLETFPTFVESKEQPRALQMYRTWSWHCAANSLYKSMHCDVFCTCWYAHATLNKTYKTTSMVSNERFRIWSQDRLGNTFWWEVLPAVVRAWFPRAFSVWKQRVTICQNEPRKSRRKLSEVSHFRVTVPSRVSLQGKVQWMPFRFLKIGDTSRIPQDTSRYLQEMAISKCKILKKRWMWGVPSYPSCLIASSQFTKRRCWRLRRICETSFGSDFLAMTWDIEGILCLVPYQHPVQALVLQNEIYPLVN